MTKASNNEFPSVLFDEQASTPSTPGTGLWRLYFKSDGLYAVDDAGTEVGPLGGGGTYDLIETQTLGSAAAAVTFSSIAATYSDLRIVAAARSARSGSPHDTFSVRMGNGSLDTGSNYAYTSYDVELGAANVVVAAGSNSATSIVTRFIVPGATATANALGPFTIDIPNYRTGSVFRQCLINGGNPGGGVDAGRRIGSTGGVWKSTSAVDTISLFPTNGDWVAGSTFRLYGIG